MKFSLLTLATVLASVDAIAKPSVSLSVCDGTYEGVEGLDPCLSWSDSASLGDSCDLDFGLEASLRPTTDVASLPKSLFGRLSTRFGGWGLAAGAQKDFTGGGTAIDLTAEHEGADLSLAVTASAEGGVDSVTAKKSLGSFTIQPSYSVADSAAGVAIGYSSGGTSVDVSASADAQEVVIQQEIGDNTKVQLTASMDSQEVVLDQTLMENTHVVVTASADSQEVTVSQSIGDDDVVSATLGSGGDTLLGWDRDLGGDNKLSATVRLDESIDVEWKDDHWTATIHAGLSGASVEGVSVHVNRDVGF